jgi:signal transduction histidine kinase
MQRKLELLERRHAIERERGRIAKDIHDDLGSSLTRIMMLGERAADGLGRREDVGPHVEKIVSSARHTVQALDEIVWAVNPDNDTLEGLVEYISHYADEFFENSPVSCRLEIPAKLPEVTLPAEIRHDLFLAIKEAFNNILKHSQASQLLVQISASPSSVEIAIEDNGCGFDPAGNGNGRKGNGLENMRKRIERIGGKFSFESSPGQGTKVRVSVRLNPSRSLN